MTSKFMILLLVLGGFTPLVAEEQKPVPANVQMIDWYKKNIAPMKVFTCDYYPSCSQYTRQAMLKYGFVKGWLMGCDRLMRCHHGEGHYHKVIVEGETKKYNPVP